MKMTDDLADQLRNKLRNIISGYRINEDDAGWLEGLMAARLAADQQKGGGEVVYQVKLNGPIDAWVDTTESQFALAEDHEKRRRKLYTTPQPSIPAPAQQVDDQAVAADNYRWLRCGGWEVLQDPKYWRPEYGFDGAIAAARADVATNAALAHPPHADQETQG